MYIMQYKYDTLRRGIKIIAANEENVAVEAFYLLKRFKKFSSKLLPRGNLISPIETILLLTLSTLSIGTMYER